MRRRRSRRRLFRPVRCVPAVLLAVGLFYWFATTSLFLTEAVLPRLGRHLGMQIAADALEFELLPGRLAVDGLAFDMLDAGPVRVAANRLETVLNYRGLLAGRIAFDRLHIDRADVAMRFTVGDGEPLPETVPLPFLQLGDIAIRDSRLRLLWHNVENGRDFDLVTSKINGAMPELVSHRESFLHFTADGHYSDGIITLAEEGGGGSWTLFFPDDALDIRMRWLTRSPNASGRIGPFDWPDSEADTIVNFAGLDWHFEKLTATDGESSFDLKGLLGLERYELHPGSRVTAGPGMLRRWCGDRFDPGEAVVTVNAEGAGTYAHPAFAGELSGRRFACADFPELEGRLVFDAALDWPARCLSLNDFDLQIGGMLHLYLPEGKPLAYDWDDRFFTAAGSRMELELDAVPGEWLNYLTPFSDEWRIESGVLSGNLGFATLAAGMPAIGAQGELALNGFRWHSPQGVSEEISLATRFDLEADPELLKLPSWRSVLSMDSVPRVVIDGAGRLDLVDRRIDFSVSAPVLEPDFLPVSHRETVEEMMRKLQLEHVAFEAAGSFRPRRLNIDRLKLVTPRCTLSMKPEFFTPEQFPKPTGWELQFQEWDLAMLDRRLTGFLAGSADFTVSPERLSGTGVFELTETGVAGLAAGMVTVATDAVFDFDDRELHLANTRIDGGKIGSWTIPVLDMIVAPVFTPTAPFSVSGLLPPALILPELAGDPLPVTFNFDYAAGQLAFSVLPQTPLEYRAGPWLGWPLLPELTGTLQTNRDTGDFTGGAAVAGSSGDGFAVNAQMEVRGNWRDQSGTVDCRVGELRFPMLTTVTMANSDFHLRRAPDGVLDGSADVVLLPDNDLVAALRWNWRADADAVTVENFACETVDAVGNPVARIAAQLSRPYDPDLAAEIRVTLGLLDWPALAAREWHFLPGEDAERPPSWSWDTGRQPWRWYLVARELTPVPEFTIAGLLSGTALGREITFELADGEINGAKLALAGRVNASDEAQPPEFQLRLHTNELELQPLWQRFDPDNSDNHIHLAHFAADLSGVLAAGENFWDRLEGWVEGEFADIDIANRFQDTALGKILLLPLEAYLRLRALLPSLDNPLPSFMLSDFSSIYSHTARFRFDTGRVKVTAGGRRLYLEQFELTGDSPSAMAFSGSLGLGSDRTLDLDTSIDFRGVMIPFRLEGTVDDPEVRWDQTTLMILQDNILSLGSMAVYTPWMMVRTGYDIMSGRWFGEEPPQYDPE